MPGEIVVRPLKRREPTEPSDRRRDASSLTLMSLNAEFLWDGLLPEEGCDRIQFPWKGNPVAAADHMERIAEIIVADDPDVVVLCEVENESALEIFNRDFLAGRGYRGYIEEGLDIDTGQDVGLLTRIDPVEVGFYAEFGYAGNVRKGLAKNIYAKLEIGRMRMGLIGIHLVARPNDRQRRRAREAQADALRTLAIGLRKQGYPPVICGDFNDYDGSDEALDAGDNYPISQVLEIVRELNPRSETDDLVNASEFVPNPSRYTVVRGERVRRPGGSAPYSSIDHILLAQEFEGLVEQVEIPHVHDPDGATRHYPIVVRIRTDGA